MGPDGALYMLDKFGYLLRAQSNGSSYQLDPEHPVAYVGPGRPLGFHFDATGNLLICDSLKVRREGKGEVPVCPEAKPHVLTSYTLNNFRNELNQVPVHPFPLAQGLTMLEAGTGRLEVLANRASPQSRLAPGSPIHYANDLDVAPDGRVFFSDATAIPPALNNGGWYDTMRSYLLTVWQVCMQQYIASGGQPVAEVGPLCFIEKECWGSMGVRGLLAPWAAPGTKQGNKLRDQE